MQWNRAEYYLEETLRLAFQDTPGLEFLLGTMGNESRATLTDRFVKSMDGDPAFSAYCETVLTAMNVCRENRNLIVHGNIENMSPSGYTLLRLTKNIEKRLRFEITLDILKEVERDCIEICAHLIHVQKHIFYTHPAIPKQFWNAKKLAKKLPSPRSLLKTLQPILDGDQLLLRS